jgi:hypothetical protein
MVAYKTFYGFGAFMGSDWCRFFARSPATFDDAQKMLVPS